MSADWQLPARWQRDRAANVPRQSASYEMREGDARHVILECAAEWRPAVIVIGSHGRTGVDRFLLGSVSENVVLDAACSVAIVRGAQSTPFEKAL
jgi:nucleotide-binding universal stress UspA family protein